jgi:hypothetical protein
MLTRDDSWPTPEERGRRRRRRRRRELGEMERIPLKDGMDGVVG